MTDWEKVGTATEEGVTYTVWKCPVCDNIVYGGFQLPKSDCPYCREKELREKINPELS